MLMSPQRQAALREAAETVCGLREGAEAVVIGPLTDIPAHDQCVDILVTPRGSYDVAHAACSLEEWLAAIREVLPR